LLLEIEYGENLQSKDIFEKLKKFTVTPFLSYFFKNSIKSYITYYSFEEVLLLIELLSKSSPNIKLNNCMIRLKDYSTKENIFILKFFISKIKRLLKRDSLIFRVSINKIILIISESDINDVINIIDRINSTTEVIKVNIFDTDNMNNKELIDFLLN
jgi:RNA-binding protein YhbY